MDISEKTDAPLFSALNKLEENKLNVSLDVFLTITEPVDSTNEIRQILSDNDGVIKRELPLTNTLEITIPSQQLRSVLDKFDNIYVELDSYMAIE